MEDIREVNAKDIVKVLPQPTINKREQYEFVNLEKYNFI